MLVAELAQSEKVFRGGRLNSALTLYALNQNRSRPGADCRLSCRKIIKRNIVVETLHQRVKAFLHFLLTRGGDAGQRPAVERIQSRDDLVSA